MEINNYEELIKYLFTFQDKNYLDFNKKIINSPSLMIGIRTPILKNIAKEISKKDYISFLNIIKNRYYEEGILEGFVLSRIKDEKTFDIYFDKFISKIDNWATCDMGIGSMKRLSKNEKYFDKALELIKSDKEFAIRCGYIIMMDYFLDSSHIDRIISAIDKNKSNYYYVNMAKAWLISVCFVKERDKTLEYILNNNLDNFTHNKAIQKIIESNRVSKEDKDYLRTLKK